MDEAEDGGMTDAEFWAAMALRYGPVRLTAEQRLAMRLESEAARELEATENGKRRREG